MIQKFNEFKPVDEAMSGSWNSVKNSMYSKVNRDTTKKFEEVCSLIARECKDFEPNEIASFIHELADSSGFKVR